MENIIDKINIGNLKIDGSINTIIKYNRKDIKLDDDYFQNYPFGIWDPNNTTWT